MDLANNLEIILTYLEKLNAFNGNRVKLSKFQEQRDNISDLKVILEDFQLKKDDLTFIEKFDTKDTQEKLMIIHKFTVDLSWHISEIQDLNDEMVKTRIGMKNN